MHLVDINNLLDRLILTDNHSPESGLERACLSASFRRI
jgi:hypothetical protein